MNLIYNHKFLNCTKETLFCIEQAIQMAIKYDFTSTVKPIHLILSLLFNSSLLKKIFKINYLTSEKEIILKSIFFNKIKKLNNSSFNFSLKIVEIFNILNVQEIPFNTLILFYFLIKTDKYLFNLVSKILNLDINTSLKNINKYILKYKYVKIPNSLKNIINIIDEQKKIKILGRDEEILKINEILNRNINKSVLLIGEDGIGKYSIVKKISTKCKNLIFLELNILNFIAYLNNKFELIDLFFNFIENTPNVVLCCKNINALFNSSSQDFNYLKNLLIEKLQNNQICLLGTITLKEYNKLIEENSSLNSIFNIIPIKEPNNFLLYSIIKQYIKENIKEQKFIILENTIKEFINLIKKNIKDYSKLKIIFLILDSLINKYKNNKKETLITIKEIKKQLELYIKTPHSINLKEISVETNINKLEKDLKNKVYGQNIAIHKILGSLKRAYIGLKDKNKPIGSWLLCGPSGTGKTELVKSLANLLFGSEKELIRFDMSEFMEKHSISKLIGSPPGYIGFEEGGLLTEAVKKKPYSVILFDEIEKAHKDINNIMLQILDEGKLTDSKGESIDFTNTLIIYTSNLGCPTSISEFNSFKEGNDLTQYEYKLLTKKVDIAIKKFFRPEFLNRLDSVIVFKPLSITCLSYILEKFIYNLSIKLRQNDIPLYIELDKEIKILLSKISYHPLYGARPLKRVIEQFIEKPISELILSFKLKKPHLLSIYVNKKNNTINFLLKRV